MEKPTVSTNSPLPAAALERPNESHQAKSGHPVPNRSGRDRYLDMLRAIALTRIVAYHTFSGVAWLTLIFPSMGVMFALAGSLMARSLERPWVS
jgi:peptidoglycan/LPS O-acetylase OafA/YrhL